MILIEMIRIIRTVITISVMISKIIHHNNLLVGHSKSYGNIEKKHSH